MARAKVTLRGCRTFQGKDGRLWKQGQTRIITDTGKIRYFRALGEFVVTVLEDAPPPKEAAPSEKPGAYTQASLGRMTKDQIQTLGAERFELILESSERKEDMIVKVLEAQGKAQG